MTGNFWDCPPLPSDAISSGSNRKLRRHQYATQHYACTPFLLTSRTVSLSPGQALGVALLAHATLQPPEYSKQCHFPNAADPWHSPINTVGV